METVSNVWEKNKNSSFSFLGRINFYRALENQLPPSDKVVIFTASGTMPAATFISKNTMIFEHKLYWSPVQSDNEGRFLSAILNSETARSSVEHLQSRGQWGARDFDKVMFTLPIPPFDPNNGLHAELAEAGARAEQVAARVPLTGAESATRARRAIRQALADDSIDSAIDDLVSRLLFGEPLAAE
jgi:hypothetical protein